MNTVLSLIKKYSYIIAATIVSLFFIVYFLIVRKFYPGMADRSYFGEMFGGINALFSGFAFLGVIYTIILQRKELKLQREELELTREELRKSAEAQAKSEQALREQVESMKKTAELNGLSAILQYHGLSLVSVMTGQYPDVGRRDSINQEATKIKQKIEEAIER